MEAKLEKKLKAYLPYIIVIGVIYLFLPVFLVIFDRDNNYLGWHHVVYIAVFPLTALIASILYAKKNGVDILFALIAPIFYIPSAFLYGNFSDSVINTLIYLIAYFLCGYLGLLVGDMLSPKKKDAAAERQRAETTAEPRTERRSRPPRKVAVEQQDSSDDFRAEDPYTDDTLNTSTTTDDIDAILAEIHSRRN